MLDERWRALDAALNWVDGRTEWGVKAYGQPEVLAEGLTLDQESPSEVGAGTAYLLRRKAQLSAREAVERTAAAQADQVHAGLAARAVAARRHPPQDPQLAGAKAWMVLNGTYLVDDARGEAFEARVSELNAQWPGLRLELTGPWPPYSFAGLEQADR